MPGKLKVHVHVDGTAYGPGDHVPDHVAARITNPDVWDGDPPSHTTAQQVAGLLPMPPKAGPGSGVDAWRSYAQQEKVTVPDGAGRDEIVAAIEVARS